MNDPFVSIVVAARNAEKTIEKCLNSILNMDYTNFELIVVDDGSTDKTSQILKELMPKGTVMTNSRCFGPAQSRNIAAQRAKGECIVFTDADCQVKKSWIRELLIGFNAPGIVSVGGSQEVPEDETDFGRRVARFMKKTGFLSDYMRAHDKGIIPVNHNASCNVIYKKNIFLKEGGFQEGLWPGEDVELDHRLRKKGYGLVFNPRAIVYHYRPSGLRPFCKMMYRYGGAQGFLVRNHGIFRRIQLVPFLSWIALPLTFVISINHPVIVILAFLIFAVCYFDFDLFLFAMGVAGFISWNLGFLRGLCLRHWQ